MSKKQAAHRRPSFRESDVTRAIKAVRKAGVPVSRVEISDGKITLVADGAPNGEPVSKCELDEWVNSHAHKA
jgi:hypothetical protein